MLGKLFKHEYKETGKYILPLLAALIGLTVVGCFSMGLYHFYPDNDILTLIMAGFMMMYMLGLFAICVLIIAFLVMHYYKTMFSARGYLTHTLPVTGFSVVNTKLLTAVSWLFLTALCLLGSVFAILFVGISSNVNAAYELQTFNREFQEVFSMSIFRSIIYALLLIIFSCFSCLLTFYASLSIGQLFGQHKILWSIVAYVGIYIINQILSFILLFFTGFFRLMTSSQVTNAQVGSFMNNTMYSSYVLTFLIAALCYGICIYITRKHLNLE